MGNDRLNGKLFGSQVSYVGPDLGSRLFSTVQNTGGLVSLQKWFQAVYCKTKRGHTQNAYFSFYFSILLSYSVTTYVMLTTVQRPLNG